MKYSVIRTNGIVTGIQNKLAGGEILEDTHPDVVVYLNIGKKEDIKQEAQRRINLLAPEWKQRNMIARSVELTEIIASGGTLTTEESTEKSSIESIWSQVKAIRSASDSLESSLPDNYTDDIHWP